MTSHSPIHPAFRAMPPTSPWRRRRRAFELSARHGIEMPVARPGSAAPAVSDEVLRLAGARTDTMLPWGCPGAAGTNADE